MAIFFIYIYFFIYCNIEKRVYETHKISMGNGVSCGNVQYSVTKMVCVVVRSIEYKLAWRISRKTGEWNRRLVRAYGIRKTSVKRVERIGVRRYSWKLTVGSES